jgi:hypothetical protein
VFCCGPHASHKPSAGEGTRQHVGLYSITELCILGGFPTLSILCFPELLLPSSSMHAAIERFRLFACFGRSLSLSLWWAYPLLPPLSMGQWHVEPLSTMAQICGDGPDSLFLLFGSATSGEAVRTSPRLLLAAHPLNTVVAAAEVMLLLNNAKRSGLYGASSTLPSLLSPVESSNCESGPCASRCEHCIVLSIVSSGLDGLRSPPVRSNATASSLSVSLSLYICLLCSELDGLHLQVC